jgi:bifunctional DNase/RNase
MVNWAEKPEDAMANIEMVIDSIRVSLMNPQGMSYQGGSVSGIPAPPRIVILKEKEGARYLPIWIGPAEADSIAVKIQGVSLSRPLTHDFICVVIDALGASLQSAIINELENDTFYAKVVLQVEGEQLEIDCRPSDALAVAVRKGVPIFADEEVLKKAGVLLDEETGKTFEPSSAGATVGQKVGKGRLDIFSEAVQDILATSEAEAKRLNCGYVCTGHLLMALAKETNTATKVMENAGVNLGRIQLDIKTLMKEEHAIEGGGIGLTPAVREAIQISIAEAKRLGSEEVLPEHVLLGLVRASDAIAANQLKNSGITPETVYIELIRLYTGNRLW